MISQISLENFKCFKQAELNFNKLTILTGVNSTGKSSAVQPLLLLRNNHLNDSENIRFEHMIRLFYNKQRELLATHELANDDVLYIYLFHSICVDAENDLKKLASQLAESNQLHFSEDIRDLLNEYDRIFGEYGIGDFPESLNDPEIIIEDVENWVLKVIQLYENIDPKQTFPIFYRNTLDPGEDVFPMLWFYQFGSLLNCYLSINSSLLKLNSTQELLHEYYQSDEIKFEVKYHNKVINREDNFLLTFKVAYNYDTLNDAGWEVQEVWDAINKDADQKDVPKELEKRTNWVREGYEKDYDLLLFKNHLVLYDGTLRKSNLRFFDEPLMSKNGTHLISNRFFYVRSERMNPKDRYRSIESEDFGALGVDGENTLVFLDQFKHEKCPNTAIQHPTELDLSLIAQVNAWLREIRSGVNIEVKPRREDQNFELRFVINHKEVPISNKSLSPYNVGYGLTYVLPIVVALVASPPDSMVILENPEAHLHPRGQTKLGELCARAASGGVQVIVETHSDHLLNGIRLAVKRKLLSPDDTQVNYFRQELVDDFPATVVDTPKIDSDGRIDFWPEGFFDEIENTLFELLSDN